MVKYHLISITKSTSKILISNFFGHSQIKDINISNGIFILLPGSCPQSGTWGVVGGQKLNVWIGHDAPSNARSSSKVSFDLIVFCNDALHK